MATLPRSLTAPTTSLGTHPEDSEIKSLTLAIDSVWDLRLDVVPLAKALFVAHVNCHIIVCLAVDFVPAEMPR